ncbi:hypothetical protein ALI144C_31270 [Actinosynnema sp. ALI-1.44]|uniref:anthrone oxygenase family protein n=1 Tax=Actinosynnema sp. ALI-1.44 TaxID=1933779 RepID=UPI00097C9B8D|nr:DUF1772 domain-containing protein [Actinosynnema sp. ALI-1.44]ONI77890.1 hypothetical protein ALI144C_31270 [Actinosynnema sp. ALI-1.44]
MITGLLGVVALVGSGVVTGVLFAVMLSVLPALMVMPVDRYVYTHQLIGRHWDPAMPIIVLGSTLADLVLVVLSPGSRWLFAAGAMLLIGVSVISHFRNVPINRRIKCLDPDDIPEGWSDPRRLWRRWHALRTVLAMLALVVNAAAFTLR